MGFGCRDYSDEEMAWLLKGCVPLGTNLTKPLKRSELDLETSIAKQMHAVGFVVQAAAIHLENETSFGILRKLANHLKTARNLGKATALLGGVCNHLVMV